MTTDGTLLAAGADTDGQVSTILHDSEGKRITRIAGGRRHVLAVTEDGALLAAGSDVSGSVSGIVKAAEGRTITAVAAGSYFSLALTADGSLLAAGDPESVPEILRAAEGKKIAFIGNGGNYILAVTADGTLLAAGAGPGPNRGQTVAEILAATEGRSVLDAACGIHDIVAVLRESDDCGPLQPRQICASFVKAIDHEDVYALALKVGTEQQLLTSGDPCTAIDTQEIQVTHLIVQRVSPPQDLAVGSAYFTYNQATGAVDIDTDKSQLPAGLVYERSRLNRFVFTWNA
ncbi:hypothetical protein KO481_23160 [Nocardia sp. NEAU-G5]|uniref:Calcium-dependent cell adhesion molecule 1 membrane-binding domain-containing protein n=1 Tax=Nocardia albiluteola TaxID=2842303 RepID=A0ABS6B4Y3_9NOCA|nr:hypothetical protein [Nocardia albiluteola]MBU3064420.1 hypothetical protein [Nocardia albiluteola]